MCSKCVVAEAKETGELYDKYTVGETDDYGRWEELSDLSKNMTDHQFNIVVFAYQCPYCYYYTELDTDL